MNILFVSDWINPFDSTYGGAQRSNLLLRACCRVGIVDVVVFVDGLKSNIEGCKVVYSGKIQSSHLVGRLKKWVGLLWPWNPSSIYPIDSKKEHIIGRLMAQKSYDVIVVRYVPDAMLCGLNKYANKLVIDMDDVPGEALKITARKARSIFNKLYYWAASCVVPITVWRLSKSIKATLFSNVLQVKGKNGFFLPNIPWEEPSAEYVDFSNTLPSLFFIGKLDHYPNYCGLDWFVEKVWPLIKSKVPNAELRIGGKVEQQSVVNPYLKNWVKYEGVTILGFVEDINLEYTRCRATISPIFYGAGTNIKLVESMQRKRVCVTTICGMRGMDYFFEKGKSILVSDDVEEFSTLCIRVLTDEAFNHQVAHRAFEQIENQFCHDVFNRVVEEALNSN